MSVMKIVTEGEPVLRRKAREITQITKRLRVLVKNMLETMYEANGVGLAAPQVGVSERLVVIDVGNGPLVLINPEIVKQEGQVRDVEGCLSIPGRSEYITRAQKTQVKFTDLNGKTIVMEGEDLLARAFQHEIDHLDGVLFVDYLKTEEKEK
ncbi:MAG TPA: peptide deformylase [Bacillota bacterium]|nr:peptide deformylase [Bacillota bacterium]